MQSYTADEAKMQNDQRAVTAAKHPCNWKMTAFRSNLLCPMVTRLHCTYNVFVKISRVWLEGGGFIGLHTFIHTYTQTHTRCDVLYWWLKHFCNDMNVKWVCSADCYTAVSSLYISVFEYSVQLTELKLHLWSQHWLKAEFTSGLFNNVVGVMILVFVCLYFLFYCEIMPSCVASCFSVPPSVCFSLLPVFLHSFSHLSFSRLTSTVPHPLICLCI